MAVLVLDETDQQVLRSLLQLEPVPGTPVPTSVVLQSVLDLVPGEAIGVTVDDGAGTVLGEVSLPRDPEPGATVLRHAFEFGCGHRARLRIERPRPFGERDVAMLRLLTPALVRLMRVPVHDSVPGALTLQERRVLGLVAQGCSNTEVAVRLHVSVSTVRKHLEHAYRKLGVHNRWAAVAALGKSA